MIEPAGQFCPAGRGFVRGTSAGCPGLVTVFSDEPAFSPNFVLNTHQHTGDFCQDFS